MNQGPGFIHLRKLSPAQIFHCLNVVLWNSLTCFYSIGIIGHISHQGYMTLVCLELFDQNF